MRVREKQKMREERRGREERREEDKSQEKNKIEEERREERQVTYSPFCLTQILLAAKTVCPAFFLSHLSH